VRTGDIGIYTHKERGMSNALLLPEAMNTVMRLVVFALRLGAL